MKVVTIKYFKEKYHNRVTFVKILTEFNSSITLKPAKELLDLMLDGTPIEYSIADQQVERFLQKLDELNLEYKIKSG